MEQSFFKSLLPERGETGQPQMRHRSMTISTAHTPLVTVAEIIKKEENVSIISRCGQRSKAAVAHSDTRDAWKR